MYLKLLFLVYLLTQNVTCIPKEFNIAVLLEDYDQERTYRFAIADFNLKKGNNFRLNSLMISVDPNEPFSTLNRTCDALAKGIVGIFGPATTSNIQIVQSLSDTKEIPLILTHWAEPLGSGVQINLYPQTRLLSKAYLDIINYLNWKEFTILYTDVQSLAKLSDLIENAKDADIAVYVVNIDPDSTGDRRPILRELSKTTQTYFLLDCDTDILNDVLFEIQQTGMLTSNYNYFLTNLDTHTRDLDTYLYSGADITGIQLVNPMSNKIVDISNQLFYDDDAWDVKKGWLIDSETALIIDAVRIFSKSLKSFDVNQGSNLNCNNSNSWHYGTSVVNTLKASAYNGVTGDIKFDSDGQREGLELTIFKLKEGGITQIGSWNTTMGINITEEKIEEKVETDVNNGHLVVITTLTEPYSMYRESPHTLPGNDKYEGFAIDLIHEISKMQGFNYTIITRNDQRTGWFDPDHNKWTGMISDIIEGRADLAISDITITHERQDAVDFTSPFMYSGISILYRKPLLSWPGIFHFARPFAADFWRAIGFTYVAVVLSLYIIGRLCRDEWQKTNTKSEYVVNQLTFSNAAWLAAGGLFRQNTQVKIRSIPGRIIAATWGLFCFVLIAMYISTLISHTSITEEEYIVEFSDVKSLVANAHEKGIRYGAKSGGATEAFFRNSVNALYQEIYRHMQTHPEDMVKTISEGVERAESSNYAFFAESSTIEYQTNRRCNLAMYGGLLNENGYGIAVRKGSPFLTSLSTAILKLQTSGKIDLLKRKWWEERRGGNVCNINNEPIEEIQPMSIHDISGLMYITIVGIMFATLSGILEFCIHIYKFSRKFNTTLLQAIRHEIKGSFSGRMKRKIDPALLSKPTPEDEINAANETVELS